MINKAMPYKTVLKNNADWSKFKIIHYYKTADLIKDKSIEPAKGKIPPQSVQSSPK